MTTFSVRNRSAATVQATREDVWEVLTDTTLLPRLTPYLRAIDADDDRPEEKAGVTGSYELTGTRDSTRLAIDLTIAVDLPFPCLAGPAVHTAMRAVVVTMGSRFSTNLVHHLRRGR